MNFEPTLTSDNHSNTKQIVQTLTEMILWEDVSVYQQTDGVAIFIGKTRAGARLAYVEVAVQCNGTQGFSLTTTIHYPGSCLQPLRPFIKMLHITNFLSSKFLK